MIGGFEEPDAGAIYLGGAERLGLPPYKRDVNTVFQSYALFPHLTIFENVAFGLRRREPRGTTRGRVREILKHRRPRRPRDAQAAPALGRPAAAGRRSPARS